MGLPPVGRNTSDPYAPCGAVAGSLYLMVRLFGAVTEADSISGRWASATRRSNSWMRPSSFSKASTSAVWFTVMVPVALAGTPPSPRIVIAWRVESPSPDGPDVWREAPESSARSPYASGARLTGSLYSIVIWSPPVMRADTTRGAMPSDTTAGEEGWESGRRSPTRSLTVAAPSSAYDSSIPDGLSAVRFPSRPSSSTCEPAADMSDRDDTCRPLVPDTDQPPAPGPAVALTVSVNVTSIVSRETALASYIRGGWPSTIACSNDPASPIALPEPSTSSVWFTVSVPVALVTLGGLSNVITCL